MANVYHEDACRLVARLLATLQSAYDGAAPPHSNIGANLLQHLPFLIRRPDYRSARYNEAYAHIKHAYVTTIEWGALLSSIKMIQGQSAPFMEWWQKMCNFLFENIILQVMLELKPKMHRQPKK